MTADAFLAVCFGAVVGVLVTRLWITYVEKR